MRAGISCSAGKKCKKKREKRRFELLDVSLGHTDCRMEDFANDYTFLWTKFDLWTARRRAALCSSHLPHNIRTIGQEPMRSVPARKKYEYLQKK
jgi:hypothetical protein